MAEASPCRGRRWGGWGADFFIFAFEWTYSTLAVARGHWLSIASLANAEVCRCIL